jgi:hypothetical protein
LILQFDIYLDRNSSNDVCSTKLWSSYIGRSWCCSIPPKNQTICRGFPFNISRLIIWSDRSQAKRFFFFFSSTVCHHSFVATCLFINFDIALSQSLFFFFHLIGTFYSQEKTKNIRIFLSKHTHTHHYHICFCPSLISICPYVFFFFCVNSISTQRKNRLYQEFYCLCLYFFLLRASCESMVIDEFLYRIEHWLDYLEPYCFTPHW